MTCRLLASGPLYKYGNPSRSACEVCFSRTLFCACFFWWVTVWMIWRSKIKLSLCSPWRHIGEQKYTFLTLTLDGQLYAPGNLLPVKKTPGVRTDQETEWAPASIWRLRRREKCFARAWNRTTIPKTSSPKSSHCTRLPASDINEWEVIFVSFIPTDYCLSSPLKSEMSI